MTMSDINTEKRKAFSTFRKQLDEQAYRVETYPINEGAVKVAMEDWMESLPKAVVDEINRKYAAKLKAAQLTGLSMGDPVRKALIQLLDKHKVKPALGDLSRKTDISALEMMFNTFFGESVNAGVKEEVEKLDELTGSEVMMYAMAGFVLLYPDMPPMLIARFLASKAADKFKGLIAKVRTNKSISPSESDALKTAIKGMKEEVEKLDELTGSEVMMYAMAGFVLLYPDMPPMLIARFLASKAADKFKGLIAKVRTNKSISPSESDALKTAIKGMKEEVEVSEESNKQKKNKLAHSNEGVKEDTAVAEGVVSHDRKSLEKMSIPQLRELLKKYTDIVLKGQAAPKHRKYAFMPAASQKTLADIQGILRARGAGVVVDEEA